MAPKRQFTLEQITKIALGAPKLTSRSIHALHGLIHVLLKKLGCEQDTVSLQQGIESKCLTELVTKSKSSPINFKQENLTLIAPKLNEIVELEESVRKTCKQFDEHTTKAKQLSQRTHKKINYKDWQQLKVQPADGQCISCDKENELACLLLGDMDSLKKLQRRLTEPLILEFFEFEQEVNALHEDMRKLIELATANLEKLATLQGCMLAVREMREKITEHELKFLGTMEEVQDILDSILDKVQVPAIKDFVAKNLTALESHIRAIENANDCTKPAGTLMSGVRCLSCGARNICVDRGVHVLGLLPDAKASKAVPLKQPCKCGTFAQSLEMRKLILDPMVIPEFGSKSAKVENIVAPKAALNNLNGCKAVCSESFSLFEGSDGNLYRKG